MMHIRGQILQSSQMNGKRVKYLRVYYLLTCNTLFTILEWAIRNLYNSMLKSVPPHLWREEEMSVKLVIRWQPFVLCGIALLGFALRLYGLNWDAGNSFHPDERQILFHVTTLSWPTSFAQFLDPVHSPLNPHFFAYGSFPLYLLATLGNMLVRFYPAVGSFSNLTLVGRVLSALFDSGTILLTGWLALLLTRDTTSERHYGWNVAFLAATLGLWAR